MTKIDPRWGPNMMRRRGSTHEAQQVRCLTGDQGSEWIHGLNDLPAPVRRRLAGSAHNICPTCVEMEAASEATARRSLSTRQHRSPALRTPQSSAH